MARPGFSSQPQAARAGRPEKKGAARVSQVLDVVDGHASLGLSLTYDRPFLYAGALEVRE